MRTRLSLVFVFSLALRAASPPPVILVDGWYPKCATAPRTSTSAFGQLEAKLAATGIATQYFRPCSVPVQSSYARATIEELGQALGALVEQTTRQTGVSQVDVIAFSLGSPIVRAYLSGKQNAPRRIPTACRPQDSKGGIPRRNVLRRRERACSDA